MQGLTPYQILELRLRCLDSVMQTASRAGLEKGDVFGIAEKSWEFMLKALVGALPEHSETTPLKSDNQKRK